MEIIFKISKVSILINMTQHRNIHQNFNPKQLFALALSFKTVGP